MSQVSFAQVKLKTYSKKIKNGFEFLADNNEYCPVSVQVMFELSNMESSEGNNKIFVVPARTKGFLISTLKSGKRGRYGYRSKTRFNYGDHFNEKEDVNYVYDLPYQQNKKFKVYQGYNGSFSHQNKKALDFTMPVGTDILASRSGIVVKVVENNTKNCGTKECVKYNNSILIYHNDGTFASYVHIKFNGALVEVGDKVEKGQLIAKSGNVGWSTGPHLHFSVFNQKIGKRETIPTQFRINSGEEKAYLKEKESYLKSYE